jgi:hypothetical protein
MSEFVIHALSVNGGILALSPLPGRGGGYADDLAHIHDWRPALMISLTPMAEMEAEGVPGLGGDIQGMGARWAHLPVPDFGVPDRAEAKLWPDVSTAARAALSGGGRVLVHCKGGCGRSGMAVLRLMIEAGEEPQSALARLRKVRPCAVETEAQMQWALAGVA